MMMTNKILIEEVDELKMCFHEVKWRYHLFGHVYATGVIVLEYDLRPN